VPVPGTYWTPQAVQSGPQPPATASNEGVIQLAGDLGGTAAAPVVESIQGTAISAPPGVTTQFLAGNGTWQVPPGGAYAPVQI
jgi:hypothetical protein